MGLLKKAAALAATPQGRQMIDKAKRWADQPENRQKIRSMGERVVGKRSAGWPQPPRENQRRGPEPDRGTGGRDGAA